jgi:hypothetical protein
MAMVQVGLRASRLAEHFRARIELSPPKGEDPAGAGLS